MKRRTTKLKRVAPIDRWPCMAGEPIVTYLPVGKEQYSYTARMLERRQERLVATSQALFEAL